MRARTFAAAAIVAVTALALSAPFVRSYTRAAALIVRMAGLEAAAGGALAWEREPITADDTRVPTRHGEVEGADLGQLGGQAVGDLGGAVGAGVLGDRELPRTPAVDAQVVV
ncbi:MAG TPA: hypothetical protein PLT35_09450, partial [Vicinamibacterales bacterium]|nr:hypothetical protein [Vicinamibacterales bacterium]